MHPLQSVVSGQRRLDCASGTRCGMVDLKSPVFSRFTRKTQSPFTKGAKIDALWASTTHAMRAIHDSFAVNSRGECLNSRRGLRQFTHYRKCDMHLSVRDMFATANAIYPSDAICPTGAIYLLSQMRDAFGAIYSRFARMWRIAIRFSLPNVDSLFRRSRVRGRGVFRFFTTNVKHQKSEQNPRFI